jgi:hypothetical protein
MMGALLSEKMRDAKVWRNVISLWVQIPLAFDFAQAERREVPTP